MPCVHLYLLSAILAAGSAEANPAAVGVVLAEPIRGLALMDPSYPPPKTGIRLYGATGPNPNWSIAQWHIPRGALSAFSSLTSGESGWIANSVAATVVLKGDLTKTLIIHQRGAGAPCDTSNGKPLEFDLFAHPNGATIGSPGVPGMLPVRESPALATLHSLFVTGSVAVDWKVKADGPRCKLNQGSALVSLILVDEVARPSQTLFYQLALSSACGGAEAGLKPCLPHRALSPFSRSNPFGVDDFLPRFDQNWLSEGKLTKLHMNLLPALNQAIAAIPSMDQDLQHWRVNSLYVGSHTWGAVDIDSTWDLLHFEAN